MFWGLFFGLFFFALICRIFTWHLILLFIRNIQIVLEYWIFVLKCSIWVHETWLHSTTVTFLQSQTSACEDFPPFNSWLTVWSSNQNMRKMCQQARCWGTAPTLRTRCDWRLLNPQQRSQVRIKDTTLLTKDNIWFLSLKCDERAKGALHIYTHTYIHTYSIHAHGQLKSHRIKKWMFSDDNIAVLPTMSSPRSSALKWKKQQNVYNHFVNGKEKQMCLHVNERKFETTFRGAFLLKPLFENCFMMSRPRGCYVWLCLLYVCVCERADMSRSGWLIRAKV